MAFLQVTGGAVFTKFSSTILEKENPRLSPVSPLCLQIALAQSQDCANVLRNPEMAQMYCAVSRLAAQP